MLRYTSLALKVLSVGLPLLVFGSMGVVSCDYMVLSPGDPVNVRSGMVRTGYVESIDRKNGTAKVRNSKGDVSEVALDQITER